MQPIICKAIITLINDYNEIIYYISVNGEGTNTGLDYWNGLLD